MPSTLEELLNASRLKREKEEARRRKHALYLKEWRAANPERCKEYRNRNIASKRASAAAYREANREAVLEGKKRWYEANKERCAVVNRKRALERLYGLSESDWEALFVAQGKMCAICKSDKPSPNNKRTWAVDHCHSTGKVRGILCHMCNTALGKFKDDTAVLQSAIDYLERQK